MGGITIAGNFTFKDFKGPVVFRLDANGAFAGIGAVHYGAETV